MEKDWRVGSAFFIIATCSRAAVRVTSPVFCSANAWVPIRRGFWSCSWPIQFAVVPHIMIDG
jgi:hypothetical protein